MMNYSKAYNNCVIDFTLNTLDMLNLRSHLTFLSIKTWAFLKLNVFFNISLYKIYLKIIL